MFIQKSDYDVIKHKYVHKVGRGTFKLSMILKIRNQETNKKNIKLITKSESEIENNEQFL